MQRWNPPTAVWVARQPVSCVVRLMAPGHTVGCVQWVAFVTQEYPS